MRLLFFVILFFCKSYSQVGIGIVNIDSSALLQLESTTQTFVPPRISTAEMNAITTPLEGSFVFNTTLQVPFVFINGVWIELVSNRTPTLLLRRNSGVFATSLTNEFQFPLNASHVVANDSSVYTVNSDGKITILKAGIYTFSATISTTNLASGNRKFYLKLYKNGMPTSILSHVNFSMPFVDYWGGGGVFIINALANDVFDLRYFLNEDNANKNIAILSYNITKMR
jgi:hypothetical protein